MRPIPYGRYLNNQHVDHTGVSNMFVFVEHLPHFVSALLRCDIQLKHRHCGKTQMRNYADTAASSFKPFTHEMLISECFYVSGAVTTWYESNFEMYRYFPHNILFNKELTGKLDKGV